MKLKTLSALLLSGAVFFLASCGNESAEGEASGEECNPCAPAEDAAASGTYSVNTEESIVNWEGTMTKVGGVAIYGHTGTLKLSEGSLTLEDGKITGGSFTVDMTTMTATDKNYNPEEGKTKEALIGHLSTGDFFLVDEYPTASFEIKSVDGDKITGDLTIRGNTNEATVTDVTCEVTEDGTVSASGNLTFDRQKYDVAFSMEESKGVTDMLIDDNVELSIKLVASPAEAQ